jgi:hypothetical protein
VGLEIKQLTVNPGAVTGSRLIRTISQSGGTFMKPRRALSYTRRVSRNETKTKQISLNLRNNAEWWTKTRLLGRTLSRFLQTIFHGQSAFKSIEVKETGIRKKCGFSVRCISASFRAPILPFGEFITSSETFVSAHRKNKYSS